MHDLPTHYQIVYVRNFSHLFKNVQNFVRNCPKWIIISSENFCPKIKCPKIKRPKILEIIVVNPLLIQTSIFSCANLLLYSFMISVTIHFTIFITKINGFCLKAQRYVIKVSRTFFLSKKSWKNERQFLSCRVLNHR